MSETATYRAAVVGCGRIGGFIDNEVADNPAITLPYSHAAGYTHVDRTRLVACADLREDILELFGETHDVPLQQRYTDYRAMIEKERLDILSVATQPEHRADIAVFGAQNGVRAIYCEKPMASSLAEADAMIDAVEANGVAFNMGTNRRWHPGFEVMRGVVQSGDIGSLQAVVIYFNGTLFNTASHAFDLVAFLNDDVPAAWVKADFVKEETVFDGKQLVIDPTARATIQFENGVSAHLIPSSRGTECEAICSAGTVASLNNGLSWQLRHRGEGGLVPGQFPEFKSSSPTAGIIEDLVHSLDTGDPTRSGVRLARANLEIIFGCIESHARDGARIPLPLATSDYFLQRNPDPKPVRTSP